MAKTVETVPYSFDDLYKESKALFNDSGFDVSEGSNTAQLSAVMSYLVSTLNTNTAMNRSMAVHQRYNYLSKLSF